VTAHASASGYLPRGQVVSSTSEIFTGRSEGQNAGEKNAFFLEDQNQKYFPPRIEADEPAGGSANPQFPLLALLSF
jgi:hypothetical protein